MKKKMQGMMIRMLITIKILSITKRKDSFTTRLNPNTFRPNLKKIISS